MDAARHQLDQPAARRFAAQQLDELVKGRSISPRRTGWASGNAGFPSGPASAHRAPDLTQASTASRGPRWPGESRGPHPAIGTAIRSRRRPSRSKDLGHLGVEAGVPHQRGTHLGATSEVAIGFVGPMRHRPVPVDRLGEPHLDRSVTGFPTVLECSA